MKLKQKIIMCVFLFVVGTAVNVLWSNMVNASFRKIRLSDGFFNVGNLVGNIAADEQLGKLFGVFELFVLLLCACYFFLSQRPYQANKMLGLGNETHNSMLIEQDENDRPDRGEKHIVKQIWTPWDEMAQQEQKPSEPGLHRTPFFRKGGME